ncbi:acyl-CoA dehydrogenase family protein [Bradyrhizobium liaoningense]|uniref:acyl-CoA dehydrogenase family protein n=1 Tax=Bradyrhizobium liaoningense TaxID=43992 RepID=UPI001BAC741E|nr:acyl-CoA dehydrogenase family protein [Bradyrhizobium liaoningense]MBR0858053.1 acyl-CoA dehydrogenase family protein [Bradyrhizobium liaoningense]
MLNVSGRPIYREDHHALRDSVRRVIGQHAKPHIDRWEAAGIIDRAFYNVCGDAGLFGPSVPEAYGGLGLDFSYNAVITEEFVYAGVNVGVLLQSDIVLPYLIDYGTELQKQKYAAPMARGQTIGAIAMTEPGAGSDLQSIRCTARRDGNCYVINGSKTFISNGQNCDVVIVAAKTAPDLGARGLSLFIVEAAMPGFKRGRNLDKIGQWSGDTSELFFEDVRVPAENLLGPEHGGFGCLMGELVQERLSIAVGAQAAAQRAFDVALAYTKERPAFGRTVFDFQNTRFTLADLAAKLQVGWAHVDWAVARFLEKNLTPTEASAAKYWHTEMQWQVTDAALQLHGGAGYMNESEVARLWRDARVQRIYGGTSQIMLEVIGRGL